MTDKPSGVQDPALKSGLGGGGLKIPALNTALLTGQACKLNLLRQTFNEKYFSQRCTG